MFRARGGCTNGLLHPRLTVGPSVSEAGQGQLDEIIRALQGLACSSQPAASKQVDDLDLPKLASR